MKLILQYYIYGDFINLANTIPDDEGFPYSRDICGWLYLGLLHWPIPYEFVAFLYPLKKSGGDRTLVWIESISD